MAQPLAGLKLAKVSSQLINLKINFPINIPTNSCRGYSCQYSWAMANLHIEINFPSFIILFPFLHRNSLFVEEWKIIHWSNCFKGTPRAALLCSHLSTNEEDDDEGAPWNSWRPRIKWGRVSAEPVIVFLSFSWRGGGGADGRGGNKICWKIIPQFVSEEIFN